MKHALKQDWNQAGATKLVDEMANMSGTKQRKHQADNS